MRLRKKDAMKKRYKLFKAKKIITYPGAKSRKNKVLKGPIDLTGINKVPILV